MTELMRISVGRHRCVPPDPPSCPPDLQRYYAQWKCPTCGQVWRTIVFDTNGGIWNRQGPPSWRWRRRRQRKLAQMINEEKEQ